MMNDESFVGRVALGDSERHIETNTSPKPRRGRMMRTTFLENSLE
jgi:hypothetical protein